MKKIDGKYFFERFPVFYSTSPNGNLKNRLYDRFTAIFANEYVDFSGKTVLDLAAHDGRWSWAARFSGAKHVTAIEANPIHVKALASNLGEMEPACDWYTIIQDDVVNFLRNSTLRYDIVLCLGWFYHTTYQIEVMKHLSLITPNLILDTECVNDTATAYFKVRLNRESALSSYTETFTQIPSIACLRLLLNYYGFECTEYKWSNNISCKSECLDYFEGRRVTFFCAKINNVLKHDTK